MPGECFRSVYAFTFLRELEADSRTGDRGVALRCVCNFAAGTMPRRRSKCFLDRRQRAMRSLRRDHFRLVDEWLRLLAAPVIFLVYCAGRFLADAFFEGGFIASSAKWAIRYCMIFAIDKYRLDRSIDLSVETRLKPPCTVAGLSTSNSVRGSCATWSLGCFRDVSPTRFSRLKHLR